VSSHSTYVNSDGKTITITESKELDLFLSVITGASHTASMNFISGEHFVSLYPFQTLKEQTTYAYRHLLDANLTATLTGRGYTVMTDSICHPRELPSEHPKITTTFDMYQFLTSGS